MKIAVVHDHFTQLGGAERVAEALFRLLPGATVFSTVVAENALPPGLSGADVQTSWMRHLPAMKRLYRHYLPLYPLAVASLDLTGYDLVVSSSCGFAKGIRVDERAVHVCYCHTPMRWVWRFDDYATREKFSPSKRLLLSLLLNRMRVWDLYAARQPDQFVANSHVVAERIQTIYKRHAVVVPPPIDVNRFSISTQVEDHYLVLSRLVPYKRVDLAIEACNRLRRRLLIIGDGPDRRRLQNMAGPTIEFLGRLPDEVVTDYVSQCRALLFPGEEDFGMVPLEVNSAGRPVVAFRGGGATETVIEGLNGVFFNEPTPESVVAAISDLEHRAWNPQAIRQHAERFGYDAFEGAMLNVLSSFVRLPSRRMANGPRRVAVA
jgi:glycosyltransferase involved in cell wall biosynthesis